MHWCACVCVRMWAVRSSVHARTNGFARVRARHRRLQACVVVRRAAVRRPGSGHIQQPRLGHIRRTHPTLRRCTQGSHATAKGQRNRTRRQRGSTQSRSPHPEPDILRCDGRGRRCAFCVGMPAWHRSAGEDLAARRSPVLRAPPSANSCTKLFHRVQLKFGVIGRSSSSPWARWADLRDWNRSDVLLHLLDVHRWGRNQL